MVRRRSGRPLNGPDVSPPFARNSSMIFRLKSFWGMGVSLLCPSLWRAALAIATGHRGRSTRGW